MAASARVTTTSSRAPGSPTGCPAIVSPSSFAVASIPSLPPAPSRGAAWSRMSTGPRVQFESRVAESTCSAMAAQHGAVRRARSTDSIDDDDDLRPRHLTGAPDRVHHASRLQRVRLLDLDEGAVVEAAATSAGGSRRCRARSSGAAAGRCARSPCRGSSPPAAAAPTIGRREHRVRVDASPR